MRLVISLAERARRISEDRRSAIPPRAENFKSLRNSRISVILGGAGDQAPALKYW